MQVAGKNVTILAWRLTWGGWEFAEESQKTWFERICVTSMQEVTRYSGTGLQDQGIIRKSQIDEQNEEKEEEENEKKEEWWWAADGVNLIR